MIRNDVNPVFLIEDPTRLLVRPSKVDASFVALATERLLQDKEAGIIGPAMPSNTGRYVSD